MSEPWWARLASTTTYARGRRRTTRAVSTTLVVVAATTTVLTWALSAQGSTPRVQVGQYETTHRPTLTALAAGCGPLHTVTDAQSSSVTGWVKVAGVLPYTPTVPVMGWFSPELPPADGSDPTPEQVLHEMWTGARVAWYAPDAPASVVSQLHELAGEHPEWRLRVAPWPKSRGEQLDGAVAFATWGATQTCDRIVPAIVDEVWAAGSPAPGASGEPAPQARPRS